MRATAAALTDAKHSSRISPRSVRHYRGYCGAWSNCLTKSEETEDRDDDHDETDDIDDVVHSMPPAAVDGNAVRKQLVCRDVDYREHDRAVSCDQDDVAVCAVAVASELGSCGTTIAFAAGGDRRSPARWWRRRLAMSRPGRMFVGRA